MHMDMVEKINSAWVLTASILILLMSSPGIILFYAGMTHRKNVVSVLAQGFIIVTSMSILWVIIGYSLSFSGNGNVIGNLHQAFLWGINQFSLKQGIPTFLFIVFQMGFAIVAPTLLIGGVAERMRFSAILCFMILWEIFSFYPVCHWLWGGGWLAQFGVLDFAGGLVVHVNAGVSSLVLAIVLGRRSYLKPDQQFQAHNLSLVVTGAALLWIGWFGFNAGSTHQANSIAALALLNTQIGASIAALAWIIAEWKIIGKPSLIGLACGAISGLVAVTPGAGYIGPMGALIIGLVSGLLCFYASRLKHFLRYDDALDAFSVHGIGGIIGSLLVAIFSLQSLGGVGLKQGMTWSHQLWLQLLGIIIVAVWSALVTLIILFILKRFMDIKISPAAAVQGIDRTALGEEAYKL